jgi:hypothetical protein
MKNRRFLLMLLVGVLLLSAYGAATLSGSFETASLHTLQLAISSPNQTAHDVSIIPNESPVRIASVGWHK